MNRKQFHRRIFGILLVLVMLMGCMGSALFDLQINQGDEFYARSQVKIAESQVVEPDRGDILDRNGRILVSNQTVYQVTLNTGLMGDARNDTILSLIEICRSSGVEWADSLPISTQEPFVFTTDTPYYTVATAEDGTKTRYLTKLGQLAVNMKWIEDPTRRPEPEENEPEAPEEPGFLERLQQMFFGVQEPPEPEEEQPKVQAELPSAYQLLGLICRSFELAGEGAVDEKQALLTGETVPTLNIGQMAPVDARAVAGVLYELYLRIKEISYWPPYIFAEDVDIDFISCVKEHSLNGVMIEPITTRAYHTEYAAHILGRVSPMYDTDWEYYKTLDEDGDGEPDYNQNDTIGRDGVEAAFESELRGTAGIRTIERNTNGKIVSQEWIKEPEPGNNVVLTLDIDLQKKVEDVLNTTIPALESTDTQGAACVILDVNNSDVLACASYPTFNLATYSQDYKENAENPLTPFINRALQGLYPPGSTFKMVTAIGGLEEGIITPSTTIYDSGRYTYYRDYQPRCWIFWQYGSIHGLQNVSQAITNSCNYFFFDVGRQLGIERLGDYAARFGLGQKTGIELPEKAGVMAGPEFTESLGGVWYNGNTLSASIGQESSQFTPIQLANYIAALVNGGVRNATHLLKEVKSSDYSQILKTYEPRVLSTIEIKDKNLEAVKAGMLEVTEKSYYYRDLDIKVGAKTGTAQVSSTENSNAVYVCFAPYEDPEIALAMVVERGGGGGDLTTMVVDILSYYFSAEENREVVPEENTLIR